MRGLGAGRLPNSADLLGSDCESSEDLDEFLERYFFMVGLTWQCTVHLLHEANSDRNGLISGLG